MKKIKAYIKPHKLSDVTLALYKVEGLTGMSVAEVRGFGRGWGRKNGQEPPDEPGDFRPIAKIGLFCRDELVNELIAAIEKAAHTGLRGDGKIYVIPVEQAVRISTGERGEAAV